MEKEVIVKVEKRGPDYVEEAEKENIKKASLLKRIKYYLKK